jgi:phage host-nuclease inhibitor protein Gam
MAKRTSKTIGTDLTMSGYQDALTNYALADANGERKRAQMNVELARVREKFEQDIHHYQDLKDKAFQLVCDYCVAHRAEMFVTAKHNDTPWGRVGFRLGNPRLKTLPKYTWERVLERAEQVMPQFVRTRREVDKEHLLLSRADENVFPHLASIGVYVDQDESFFIDLTKETA